MRGMLEFQERYGSEAGCIEALARLRWPQGYVCAQLAARGGATDSRRGRGPSNARAAVIRNR